MKGIYLAACRSRHPNYDIIYQDIDTRYNCDLGGSMVDIDISSYDYIIASPPCNYWSKANPYYWFSEYSLSTMNLLPLTLLKCAKSGKPFIVENVKNLKRFKEYHIFDLCSKFNINYFIVGRHIYFTNIDIDLGCYQDFDFKLINGHCSYIGSDGYRQGGHNVYNVIELWLDYVVNNNSNGRVNMRFDI